MLHLSLVVNNVKEEDEQHVMITAFIKTIATIATDPPPPPPKRGMIQIGVQHEDEDIPEQIASQIASQISTKIQETIARRPQLESGLTLYVKKTDFERLGRPTIGDLIIFDGRTVRASRENKQPGQSY